MTRTIKSAELNVIFYLFLTTTKISGQLHERYIGCYLDKETAHNVRPVLKNRTDLTIEMCIQNCYNEPNRTQSDMTFAALSNGRRCSCRNDSGIQLRDRNCNVKCSGNSQQVCGGNSASKFYSLYTVCAVGYFGPICDNLCHCKRHSPCDRKTGICPDGCDQHWTGTNCNTSNIQNQYIGCYGDSNLNDAMDVKNPDGRTGASRPYTNSNEFCIQICSSRNHTYAGMQYGRDCNCGEKYDRYGNQTKDGAQVNCNKKCPTQQNQTCGGDFANSVYYVCPSGFYGAGCLKRCHCSDGGPCSFNGRCLNRTNLCKLGWTGSQCNIRNCKINNGDCGTHEQCENINLGYANISNCRKAPNCKVDNGDCGIEEQCRAVDLGYSECHSVQKKLERYYVGCFESNEMPSMKQTVLKNATDLTLDTCIVECRRETQLTFAAVVNGSACFCSDSYDIRISDRICRKTCIGSDSQFCGGALRTDSMATIYSIYTVCPVGNFGDNCRKVCHCKRQSPCNRFTGSCSMGCERNWTGISCNESVSIQQYIGCYKDNKETPAMDEMNPGNQTGQTRQYTNSIEFCMQICSWNNYAYAGMQYGYDCNCGNTYDKHKSLPKESCHMTCPANSKQKCGGSWANSVYHTCPRGFYGRNCVDQIHSVDGRPCINGSCTCKEGWTGAACNMRDCGAGDGDCESDEICETIDLRFANLSVCRCKDGSYRDNNKCRPTHLQYVGCYVGNVTQYISVELPAKDVLTIEFCIQSCQQLNKTYSMIQDGAKCLCGDGYGRMLPDAECQVPCAGNTLQYCGGKNTSDGTPIYVVYSGKSFLRNYIGCYNDTKQPAMENKFSWSSGDNNTIDSCIRHCAFNNYKYAGLQYGYDCFCGNSYDKYGPLPEARCSAPCSGNRSQICGGNYANSVYSVNDILGCSSHSDCKRERNESCNNIDLNYTTILRCRCDQGFHRMSTWEFCEDINECEAGTSTCDTVSENCFNDIGSYRCGCKSGFVNVSGKCEDIDECRNDSLLCDAETELCKNTIGSYMCHCKPGYENAIFGNCTDVDECRLGSSSTSCDEVSQYCVNNIGSYICKCNVGYSYQSGKCLAESSSVAVIAVAASVSLVAIIIVCFVLFWFLRKRFSAKSESGESKTIVEYSNHKQEKVTNGFQETSLYSNLNTQFNNKIPVGELPALFKEKTSHPGTLEKEFKSVPVEDSTKTCREGKKKELKHRNRFQNIIPYDQNRVILHQENAFSDYINASFITSYNSEEKLIATQGPNDDTLTHFWRMIYENNVGTIVMITNLVENAKKKCSCYWPQSDDELIFDNMTITLKLTEIKPNYVIRHLQLIEGATTMNIKQWHFTVWPDHGVPSDVKGFLNFRRNVRQSMSFDSYTLVHCSAGVGRTGTFIAINYLLEQAEAEGVVDIVGCLSFLRQQRTQMVQTLDQYEFIYAALASEFTMGKTAIIAEDFDRSYKDLLVRNKSSGKTQLEIQFQALQEHWKQQVESENPSHVFAKSLDMCEISEAAQAVFVQSWKTKDAYIVPEYPDKATLNYFWTICQDYGCKLIVYLDNGQNSQQLFPKQPTESLWAASWRLECKTSKSEDYGTRLTIELSHVSESEYSNTAVATTGGELTLLNVKAYVHDTMINYDAIYSIYDALKTLGSKNNANKSAIPIVIVSRSNCSLSGLFIAAFNAFDMLDETKEVDLYQVVYDIKKSRSKLIPSLANYEELHNIVNHRIGFTSASSIYSNA